MSIELMQETEHRERSMDVGKIPQLGPLRLAEALGEIKKNREDREGHSGNPHGNRDREEEQFGEEDFSRALALLEEQLQKTELTLEPLEDPSTHERRLAVRDAHGKTLHILSPRDVVRQMLRAIPGKGETPGKGSLLDKKY